MADIPDSKSSTHDGDCQIDERHQIESWSRQILQVSPPTGDRSHELEVLKRLADRRFLPVSLEDAALRILHCDQSVGLDARAREEIRARRHLDLHGRIESFARAFFRLSPETRQRAWYSLAVDCDEFPLLKRRLDCLRPGIDAEGGETEQELLAPGSIGEAFQKLFVASRSDWPRIRQRLRDSLASQTTRSIEDAARSLQRHHPKIAALQPEVFKELYHCGYRKQRRSQARVTRVHAVQMQRSEGGSKVARAMMVVAFMAIGILGGLSHFSNDKRASTFDQPNRPWNSPQTSTFSSLSEEESLLLFASPGEQLLDVAERNALQNPGKKAYQHMLGRQLMKAARISFGIVDGVSSVRIRSDPERESYYLRACQILQGLVVEEPGNVEYSATFFEACQRYDEHPGILSAVQGHVSREALPALQQSYFEQLARNHLERNRPKEALQTLLAQREISASDPQTLFYLSCEMVGIVFSPPESNQERHDQDLIDACAMHGLVTIAFACDESLQQVFGIDPAVKRQPQPNDFDGNSRRIDAGEQVSEAAP